MPRRLGPLLVCFAAAACSGRVGPSLQLVVARPAAQEACDPAAAPDTVTSAGVNRLRLTVLTHTGGDPTPSFLCDRIVDLPGAGPNVKLTLAGKSASGVDFLVEGFRKADDGDPASDMVGPWRRVATGSLLNVKPAAPDTQSYKLRLYTTSDFRCLDAQLHQERAFHTATVLPNGQVLFIGGVTPGANSPGKVTVDNGQLFLTGTVELYDPETATLTAVNEDNPPLPRAFHQAFLLPGDAPYTIYLIGGITSTDDTRTIPNMAATRGVFEGSRLVPYQVNQALPTRAAPAEKITWDPATKTLTREALTPAPQTAYAMGFQASDGSIFVAGGADYGTNNATDLAHAKDIVRMPAAGGLVTTPALLSPRIGGTMTLLPSGSALVWGGSYSPTMSSPAELVGGLAGTPTSVAQTPIIGSTPAPLVQFPTATAVTNGVFVSGGFVVPSGGVAVQPVTGSEAPLAAMLLSVNGSTVSAAPVPLAGGLVSDPTCANPARFKPAGWESALALPDGSVLVTGGGPAKTATCNDCEVGADLLCAIHQAVIYKNGALVPAAAPMGVARAGHTMSLLSDGTVMVVGGLTSERVVPDVEIFNPRGFEPAWSTSNPGANDKDDPAAAVLTAQSLSRQPGEQAIDPTSGKKVANCDDL